MTRRLLLFSLAIVFCLAGSRLPADTFDLKSGGKIQGEWLNADETRPKVYRIKTEEGAEIEIERTQVVRVKRPTQTQLEYAKRKKDLADTVDAHFELAQWCRSKFLGKEWREHLERVLELDLDHEAAHRQLGHVFSNGEWTTIEEIKRSQGYVLHRGKWVTPQERDLIEQDDKLDKESKAWFGRLKTWQIWLGKKRAAEAAKNIRQISDPNAIRALTRALDNEGYPERRKLYLAALVNIGQPNALHVVAEHSILDPIDDVRLTCLEYLEPIDDDGVVDYFIEKLRSKENYVVNRAALGLRYVKDPISLGPLIDALVTEHKTKFQQGTPGGINPTFGGNGSGGLSTGAKTLVVTNYLQNPEVLAALEAMTEVTFDFDVPAWRRWFAGQKQLQGPGGRRDEGQ